MDPKRGTKWKTEVINEINKFVSETNNLDDMYDEFGKFCNYFSESDLGIYRIWI